MAWSGKFKNGESFNDLTDEELNRFETEIDGNTVREITETPEQMPKFKFKLNDGRIIDVDEDEIRDLVIAGADEALYDENTGEPIPLESPTEMRSRAKSEYSQDVQQQMSEYDDEHPYASTLMPKMTEAIKTNQPWYIQSTEAAKDTFLISSILLAVLLLYFLPTIICWKRKVSKKKIGMVFFLNLFAGWTFAVWMVLGVWSLSDFELK